MNCVGDGVVDNGGVGVVVGMEIIVEGYLWWWLSSGGCDCLCEGSSCNSCRSAIVKCMLHGGLVVVMVTALVMVAVWIKRSLFICRFDDFISSVSSGGSVRVVVVALILPHPLKQRQGEQGK